MAENKTREFKWLNTYQRMKSPTGKEVTVFVDNAPWRQNPWIEIKEANVRYLPKSDGTISITRMNGKTGEQEPVNSADEEYWTNYVKLIQEKRKTTPERNIFQHLMDVFKGVPVEECGGKIKKHAEGGWLNKF